MRRQLITRNLEGLPQLYTLQLLPDGERAIGMHITWWRRHWFVAEYDAQHELFFGFDVTNPVYGCWRVTDVQLLLDLNSNGYKVTFDNDWETRRAAEVQLIGAAYREQGRRLSVLDQIRR